MPPKTRVQRDLNFNLKIPFDPGDNLRKYTVERDAFIAGPEEFRDRSKEDPDEPGHIARTGQDMFVSRVQASI